MNPKIPPVLYRFRPWLSRTKRKSIGEIEGQYAYFSSPHTLNDPQDNLLGPEFTGGSGDDSRLVGHAFADAIQIARKNKCGPREEIRVIPKFRLLDIKMISER